MTRTHKMLVHDEHEGERDGSISEGLRLKSSVARPGDYATIIHGRPLSKRKHFRLHELVRDGRKVDLSSAPKSTIEAEAQTEAGDAVPVQGGLVMEALRESKGPQVLKSL